MFEVRDLLKIEEDPKILDYRITKLNIPLWLFLRFDIFFYLQMKIFNMENPHIRVDTKKLPLRKKLEYIYLTLRYHPFVNKKYDVLILGATINNLLEDNLYYNRLYDYFFNLLDKKLLLIEQSNKFNYYRPRFIKKIRYKDIIEILPNFLYRFILKNEDENTIENFVVYLNNRIENLFGFNLKDFFSEKRVSYKKLIRKTIIKSFLYNILISFIRPKLIILEDAHYGGYCNLIKLSKLKGIKVAELQHGYIGKAHLAYNFHDNIRDKIKEYFPDYMLFWGDYWANNSNIPGEKKIIGFPYLEKKYKELSKDLKVKDNFILLVSGGNIPKEYLNVGKIIKLLYPEKKLVFRPHPSERPSLNERYKELFDNGWILDNDSLYTTLSKTQICISLEVSTVLFEATIFCEKVFLIKSRASEPYLEENFPLVVINDYDKIKDYIEKEEYAKNSIEIRNKLFNPNYEENFINFIKEIGINL